MKKIINYLKGLIRKFFPRPRFAEEYIICIGYKDWDVIKEHLERRKSICVETNTDFRVTFAELPHSGVFGYVNLIYNDKVIDTAKIRFNFHTRLLYYDFNEEKQ